MSTIRKDSALTRIRSRLEDWLRSGDTSVTTTASWMRGEKLPAVGHRDEPWVWILRALREEPGSRPALEQQLAVRLAPFLKTLPEQGVAPLQAKSLYYNALSLCQEISAREILFEPLYELYEKHLALNDTYHLTSLASNSLRDALIENQTDNRLRNIWLAMSESALPNEDQDPILRGNGEIALQAVRLMPPSHDRQGQPATPEIAIVLRNISESLRDDPANRSLLMRYMTVVLATYPDHKLFKSELLRQAVAQDWGRSAIESFPADLCQPVPGENAFLIWKHHLACFPNSIQRESLCDGVLFKVNIEQHDPRPAQACIKRIEIGRRECPFPSERAMAGVAIQALQDLIIEVKCGEQHDHEFIQQVVQTATVATNSITKESDIGATQSA